MKLDFSVGTGRAMTLPEVSDEARIADELGFSHITLVDQPDLDRDVYFMMNEAARSTQRIKIGQGITVTGLRHPSVAANSMACLDEVSNGRAFLGIGSGWTAFTTKGGKRGRQSVLRETVEFIREYMTGADAEFEGARMHSEWIRKPVPIYMAAAGPKACQAAGELADGVILGPGANPEVVKWRIEHVAKGAERAGRNLSDIDIWIRTMVVPAESRAAGMHEVAAYAMLTCGLTLAMKGPESDDLRSRLAKSMPDLDDLMREAKACYDAYDPYYHEKANAPHDKLVTQRMVDFMHLVGTPDDISERISVLGELGANNISTVVFTSTDRVATMRAIASDIMPRFQS